MQCIQQSSRLDARTRFFFRGAATRVQIQIARALRRQSVGPSLCQKHMLSFRSARPPECPCICPLSFGLLVGLVLVRVLVSCTGSFSFVAATSLLASIVLCRSCMSRWRLAPSAFRARNHNLKLK